MSKQIITVDSELEWNNFLRDAQPHSFLHSWEWGEFNRKMGSDIFRLAISDNNNWDAVALFIYVKARRGSFFLCPHGPIFKNGTNAQLSLSLLTEYANKLARDLGCQFIRICPLLSATPENEKLFIDLSFRQSPIHTHPELSWVLALTPTEDELLQNMRKTTRYSIKKAQKDGVEIISSANPEDIKHFWEIYQTTVDRHNFTPFSLKYLQTEFDVFSKNNHARWYFAKYQNKIVSAALIIYDEKLAYYHHGASSQNIPQLTASHLLQWQIIKDAKTRGCLWYNFWGVVPEDAKHHPWAGLSLFKRGFGGNSEEYLHSKDLPLSTGYWLTYLIEKIRKIKRGL